MTDRIPTASELYFAPAPRDRAQLEALERRFFQTVGLANGTWKTTNRRRLDDVNALVEKHLPPHRPLRIMDVAVSSGVSTLEWLESLEQAGIECRIIAGDAAVHAFLICPSENLRALVDRAGHVLQYEVRGRAIIPMRKRHVLGGLPSVALLRVCAWALAPTLRDPALAARGERWGIKWRPLRLVSPALAERIEVIEDDILTNTAYSRCFDVVRAANILNCSYFGEATLRRMLINLRDRVKPGGLLMVCRTNRQNENHGTLFRIFDDGCLQVVERLGGGSEVEPLALGLRQND